MNLAKTCLRLAGMLLLLAAIAKIVSASSSAHIQQSLDPIFAIPFRAVFIIVGIVEMVVALICFFSKRVLLQAGLVAWISTNFAVYRFSLVLIGYHKPCSCLGDLTDALHIPSQIADTTMKIILAYLIFSSYAILFWLWQQKRKTPPLASPTKTTV